MTTAAQIGYKGPVLSESDTERVARIYRDSIYPVPASDHGWNMCKSEWLRDLATLLSRLEDASFAIVRT